MEHDENVVTVGGDPARAYRAGAGAVLVLLHDGGTDTARDAWEPVWALLVTHATVVAPDLPGYGGTALGTVRPTLDGYREWLMGFLDASRLGAVTLVGLGLGAEIAARAAPARVAGLVPLAGRRPADAPAAVAAEILSRGRRVPTTAPVPPGT
jgi:pimeloyl-ACP methyl ester carboxylesterase